MFRRLKATGKRLSKKFIFSLIFAGLGVALAVTGFSMMTAGASALGLFFAESISISGILGAVVGSISATSALIKKIKISKMTKNYLNNLEKLHKSETQSYTIDNEKAAGIIKRIRNIGLKLCKIDQCPIFGRFSILSGKGIKTKSQKVENELLNASDYITRNGKSSKLNKKYAKRIERAQLTNSTNRIWTRSYRAGDDVVYDRRVEINALTAQSKDAFKDLALKSPFTRNVGFAYVVELGKKSDNATSVSQRTYLRFPNSDYKAECRDIILTDIYNACVERAENKTKLFPVNIKNFDFDTKARYVNNNGTIIPNYESLINELGLNNEQERK